MNACTQADLGRHHGLETAGSCRRRAEEALADLAVRDTIVKKADGGRRPKAIRGIPDKISSE